jgi:hypothetical protein
MGFLTAKDALRVWESGHRQRPAERAVTILSAAFPDEDREELGRLTLGQCNARLLAVRERVFGEQLNGFWECPNCGERLEFTLSSAALNQAGRDETPGPEFELESEGYNLRFRPLEIADLNAVVATGNQVDAARDQLVERCLLEARRGDRAMPAADLPETVIASLAASLAACDAGAEILLDLVCPVCENTQQLPFDVASFFYKEISWQAQNLMREVHSLARAYGWHEAEILSMSARRRRFYLEMVD